VENKEILMQDDLFYINNKGWLMGALAGIGDAIELRYGSIYFNCIAIPMGLNKENSLGAYSHL